MRALTTQPTHPGPFYFTHGTIGNKLPTNFCQTLSELVDTLQSKMNVKLSQHEFWHCHGNRPIKTIQMIPYSLCVSFKLTSLDCGLRLILVYPNPK